MLSIFSCLWALWYYLAVPLAFCKLLSPVQFLFFGLSSDFIIAFYASIHILRCRECQLFILGLPCFLSLHAMLWDGQGWGSCGLSAFKPPSCLGMSPCHEGWKRVLPSLHVMDRTDEWQTPSRLFDSGLWLSGIKVEECWQVWVLAGSRVCFVLRWLKVSLLTLNNSDWRNTSSREWPFLCVRVRSVVCNSLQPQGL